MQIDINTVLLLAMVSLALYFIYKGIEKRMNQQQDELQPRRGYHWSNAYHHLYPPGYPFSPHGYHYPRPFWYKNRI